MNPNGKTSEHKQLRTVLLLKALDKQASYFKKMTHATGKSLTGLAAMLVSDPNLEDETENIFGDIQDLFDLSKEMHDLLLEIRHAAQRELQTEEDVK